MTDPRRVRAGDAERQAAADALAEHYTAGRLTTGEYDDRVAQAFAATYTDEFAGLFADLPSGPMNRSTRSDPFAAGSSNQSGNPWGNDDPDDRQAPRFGHGPWNNRGRSARGFAGMRGGDGPPVIAIVLGVIALFVVIGVLIAVARALVPLVVVGLIFWIVSQRRGGPRGPRRTSGPHGSGRW